MVRIPRYFNDSSSKLIGNPLSMLLSDDMFCIFLVSGAKDPIIFIQKGDKLLGDLVNMRLGTPKWKPRANLFAKQLLWLPQYVTYFL